MAAQSCQTSETARKGVHYRFIEPLNERKGVFLVMNLEDRVSDTGVLVPAQTLVVVKHDTPGRVKPVPKTRKEAVEESKMFLRYEFRVMRDLQHPNIVRTLDYHTGVHDYLVMEFAGKEDLGTWLRIMRSLNQDITQVEGFYRTFASISDALGYVHQHGIIHSDVKPTNILTPEGGPKLIDFGVSQRAGLPKIIAATSGTTEYKAPEQFRDEITYQSDMYGLGVVLYKFLTNRFPHSASALTTNSHVLGQKFPKVNHFGRAKNMPPALAELVHACLEFNPENRPSTYQARDTLRAMHEKYRQAA